VCTLPTEYCAYGINAGLHPGGAPSASAPASSAAAAAGGESSGAGADAGVAAATAAVAGLSISSSSGAGGEGGAAGAGDGAGGGGGAAPPPPKAKKGGAGASKQQVIIEVKEKGRRRHVTTISGLDSFGVKLKDAASALGKKFGAGATVGKSPTGIAEVDVQGDVAFDLPEVISALYDIPEDSIIVREA
jgi:density-regulated protein DRP1